MLVFIKTLIITLTSPVLNAGAAGVVGLPAGAQRGAHRGLGRGHVGQPEYNHMFTIKYRQQIIIFKDRWQTFSSVFETLTAWWLFSFCHCFILTPPLFWPVVVAILGGRPAPLLDPGCDGPAPLTAAPPTVCARGGVAAPGAGPGAHAVHSHGGAHRVVARGLEVRWQRVRQVWTQLITLNQLPVLMYKTNVESLNLSELHIISDLEWLSYNAKW